MSTKPKQSTDILLCVAIDISGSMKESISTESNDVRNRFEAVQRSLYSIAKRAKKRIQERKISGDNVRFDIFSYIFGLNHITHCDLFSLIKLHKDELTEQGNEIELPIRQADPYNDIINILHHFGVNDMNKYRQWAGEILRLDEAQKLRERLRRLYDV